MNVYDIAKQAGVSIATVSRVINNKGGVSEKTAEKVLKVIAESHYTPNSLARGLGKGRVRMVGIVCTEISDLYYAAAVACMEKNLRENGYETLLCCTGDDVVRKERSLDLMLSKSVDAIILVGSVFKDVSQSEIAHAASQVPVMIINGEMDIPGTYCFYSDEDRAVADTVRRLFASGRSDILYLYDAQSPSGLKKRSGFLAGLESCGIRDGESRVIRVEKSLEAVVETVECILQSGRRPDAIVASEDLLAVGTINTLVKHGIRVPEETAVIGINNLLLAQCCSPGLSSIDIRLEPLCTAAVCTLIDIFENKAAEPKTMLPSVLVLRESFPG